MTDPRSAPAPAGDDAPAHAGDDTPTPAGDDVVLRVESAADGIVGVSGGPLPEAVSRLDALHQELQGALADLDQA
ncbi:MAG: hypothetical protein ABIQ09_09335 [Jatrophihabitantaceae bacterium]